MQKSGNGDAIQKHITEQCLRMTTAQKKLTELTCPMSKTKLIIIFQKLNI